MSKPLWSLSRWLVTPPKIAPTPMSSEDSREISFTSICMLMSPSRPSHFSQFTWNVLTTIIIYVFKSSNWNSYGGCQCIVVQTILWNIPLLTSVSKLSKDNGLWCVYMVYACIIYSLALTFANSGDWHWSLPPPRLPLEYICKCCTMIHV